MEMKWDGRWGVTLGEIEDRGRREEEGRFDTWSGGWWGTGRLRFGAGFTTV